MGDDSLNIQELIDGVRKHFSTLANKLALDYERVLEDTNKLATVLEGPISLETAVTILDTYFPNSSEVRLAKLRLREGYCMGNSHAIRDLEIPVDDLVNIFSNNTNKENALHVLDATEHVFKGVIDRIRHVKIDDYNRITKLLFTLRNIYMGKFGFYYYDSRNARNNKRYEDLVNMDMETLYTPRFLEQAECSEGNYLLVENFSDVFNDMREYINRVISKEELGNKTDIGRFASQLLMINESLIANMSFLNTLNLFINELETE